VEHVTATIKDDVFDACFFRALCERLADEGSRSGVTTGLGRAEHILFQRRSRSERNAFFVIDDLGGDILVAARNRQAWTTLSNLAELGTNPLGAAQHLIA